MVAEEYLKLDESDYRPSHRYSDEGSTRYIALENEVGIVPEKIEGFLIYNYHFPGRWEG